MSLMPYTASLIQNFYEKKWRACVCVCLCMLYTPNGTLASILHWLKVHFFIREWIFLLLLIIFTCINLLYSWPNIDSLFHFIFFLCFFFALANFYRFFSQKQTNKQTKIQAISLETSLGSFFLISYMMLISMKKKKKVITTLSTAISISAYDDDDDKEKTKNKSRKNIHTNEPKVKKIIIIIICKQIILCYLC